MFVFMVILLAYILQNRNKKHSNRYTKLPVTAHMPAIKHLNFPFPFSLYPLIPMDQEIVLENIRKPFLEEIFSSPKLCYKNCLNTGYAFDRE